MPTPVNPCTPLKGTPEPFAASAFSPYAAFLASGGHDKAIRLWDVHKRRLFRTFSAPRGRARHDIPGRRQPPRFDRRGNDGHGLGYRVGNGKSTLQRHTKAPHCIAVSPDGNYFATAGADRTVVLWNAHTFEHVRDFPNQADDVNTLAFSPDSRRLAVSPGRSIHLCDVADGKNEFRLKEVAGGEFGLAFHPEGNGMAGGVLKAVHLWDVKTGEPAVSYHGHETDVKAVAFTPDGKQVVSLTDGGVVRLRGHVRPDRELLAMPSHAPRSLPTASGCW